MQARSLSLTKPLSMTLQNDEIELCKATELVSTVLKVLKNWRSGSGLGRFETVANEAEALNGSLQIDQLPSGKRNRRIQPDESAR